VKEALGGSASYFSCSASHFAPVSVVAVVGEDFPEPHRKLFAGRGIDLSGLEAAPGRTFRWRGEYMAELGHAHTLETQLNVFAEFHPKLTDVHRRIPYVFLANIDPELQLEVLSQVRKPRLVLSDTMNYWIARKPDRVLDVLRRVDVALLNEEEARALAGETHLTRAAESLLAAGAHAVIIKKASTARAYHSRDERFLTPAYPVKSLTDPTGAGDSFAGGFMGLLARLDRADGGRCDRPWPVARRWLRWRSRRSRPPGSRTPPPARSRSGCASSTSWFTTTSHPCSDPQLAVRIHFNLCLH
jgi:sugar/nucleoside kinase (ribokinase family)